MSQPCDEIGQNDLVLSCSEEIIILRVPSGSRRRFIGFLAGRFGSVCRAGPGQPRLPTRLVAGLLILKHMPNCPTRCCATVGGEPVFSVPLRRSGVSPRGAVRSLVVTRWRQRLGEEQIAAPLEENFRWRIGGGRSRAKISSAWWWTPPCRRRRFASDRCVDDPRAIEKLVEMAKRGGRGATPELSARANARPLWWGAIRMPTSSSALGGNSNSCARDLAVSSATLS